MCLFFSGPSYLYIIQGIIQIILGHLLVSGVFVEIVQEIVLLWFLDTSLLHLVVLIFILLPR